MVHFELDGRVHAGNVCVWDIFGHSTACCSEAFQPTSTPQGSCQSGEIWEG